MKVGAIGNSQLPRLTNPGFLRIFIVVAISLGLASTIAHAGTPAALALDVSGSTTPEIEPFSELETKSPIELDPETTVEFLHYASYQAVTVKGGRLNFTKQPCLSG